MPLDTVLGLASAIGAYHLLESEQRRQLEADLLPRFSDPRLLARELIQRGWLSPYQVNQLFQGRGEDLLLGSYVLVHRLGEGGMGAVFVARNWKLGRVVALKLIRKERLDSPDAVRRFRREIEAGSQLNHANVVRALDADEVNGVHFLVMEHVEGTDLARHVKQHGPLPVAEACEYVRQAALGLQHAFEHGLTHRDVKPSNLLLSADGKTVKVLDLGLALLGPEADGHTQSSSTLTDSGAVLGTPDYVAPEQALDSRRADARSDVYSLGCTLYFLLTGQAPFSGGTVTEKLLRHHVAAPPAPSQARPGVPDDVDAIVRKMMAKAPDERHQTPAEVATALAAVLANLSRPPIIHRRPGAAEKSRRWVWGGGAALLLAVVLGLTCLLWARRDGTRRDETRQDHEPPHPEWTALDRLEAPYRREAWWPDELVAVLGEERLAPESSEPIVQVAFLPDGRSLAVLAAGKAGKLAVWDLSQRPACVGRSKDAPGSVAAFSPDGAQVAVVQQDGLWLYRLDGPADEAGRQLLVRRPTCLSFSGDGRRLAAGCVDGGDCFGHVWQLEPAGGHEEFPRLTLPGKSPYVTLSPDGARLATKNGVLAVPGGKLVRKLTTGRTVAFRPPGGEELAYFSDGLRLERTSDGGLLAKFDVPGHHVCFSRDGRSLAVWTADTGDVTVVDVERKAAACPPWSLPGPVRCVAFAPDNRHLALGNGNGTVYVLRLKPAK